MDRTLLKGLQALEQIVTGGQPVKVTAFGEQQGLTKSNAHRILKTLEFGGFLKQNPHTKEYGPSLKLWELGSQVIAGMDLKEHAAGVMRQLADQTRETVHLSVLDGGNVVYIDKIDSPEPVRAYSRLGGRAPAYCVATGKAQLAYLPQETLSELLPSLEQHTPNTIADPEKLIAELQRVRELGYAVNRGEWRESVWGVADVIRAGGSVVAAIGISGPSFRLSTDQRCEEFAVMVQAAARAISKQLGSARL